MPGRVLSSELLCRLALCACLVLQGSTRQHLFAQVPAAEPNQTSDSTDRPVTPSQLTGKGRIYLLQLGPHKQAYEVSQLAAWLHEKYSLDVQVLPPTALESTNYDASHTIYVAERIIAQIKRDHPGLAADPNAFLIGFTDAPIAEAGDSDTSFSVRDNVRSAIISAGVIDQPTPDGTNRDPATLLRDRLRRMLLKDVATLFWHLPRNNNPQSILYWNLDEDTPKNELYESDLQPEKSGWGAAFCSPCIVFSYKPRSQDPLDPQDMPLIGECEEPGSVENAQSEIDTTGSPPDTSRERMELRLSDGIFTEKHTDFYLPGKVPIRLERSVNNVWQQPSAFGIGGSHNYDRSLSTGDGMRTMTIGTENVGYAELSRIPADLAVLPLNRWVDSDLVLKWRTSTGNPHFYLTRDNGEVETYMPCTATETCYFSGYSNPAGDTLNVIRDSQRNLQELSAPGGNWLRLTHEPAPNQIRVSKIEDNTGRRVLYSYNADGRVSTVTYPSGEVYTYGYDENHNLHTISVTPHTGSQPITLVTNTFEQGKLTKQTLAGGRTYRYRYFAKDSDSYASTQVTDPDGKIFYICFTHDYAIVRKE